MSSPIGDIRRPRDSCVVRDDDVCGQCPDAIVELNRLGFWDEFGPGNGERDNKELHTFTL